MRKKSLTVFPRGADIGRIGHEQIYIVISFHDGCVQLHQRHRGRRRACARRAVYRARRGQEVSGIPLEKEENIIFQQQQKTIIRIWINGKRYDSR